GPGVALMLALAGTLVWATGVVVRNVTAGAVPQAHCPPGGRGRGALTLRVLSFGVWPPRTPLRGVLGPGVAVRGRVFYLVIANVLIDVLLFIGPLKHRRELPTEPDDVVEPAVS